MRRLVLALGLGCAVPGALGQAQVVGVAKPLKFAVVSVKPDTSDTGRFRVMFTPTGIRAENASLLVLVRLAYGLQNSLDDKFLGMPKWAKTDRYDLEAKVESGDEEALKKLSRDERNQMLQAALVERFALVAHRETKEQPVYALVVAKGGVKMKKATAESQSMSRQEKGTISGQGVPMSAVTSGLTQAVGRTVLDRTGLTDKYDFTLTWTPEETAAPTQDAAPVDAPGPSVFTAVEEQLGLKLESTKGPVECLVIDHVAMPGAN